MKHLTIHMTNGAKHSVPLEGAVPDFTAFKHAVRELDLCLDDIGNYEIIEKLARKRVEVDVTVNMVLEMDEDLDAEQVVKDGSFDNFTPYISDGVKASMKFHRKIEEEDIEADQITITDINIVNEDELA